MEQAEWIKSVNIMGEDIIVSSCENIKQEHSWENKRDHRQLRSEH